MMAPVSANGLSKVSESHGFECRKNMSSFQASEVQEPRIAGLAKSEGQKRIEPNFSSGVIVEAFEAQVRAAPKAVAVVCGEAKMSYEELNERANRIAHYLRKMGVSAESMVGIYMDRTLDAIAAIVGILKAGGAYVPIDPVYPQERVGFILEDANTKIVLTEKRLASSLCKWHGRILVLETEWDDISKESGDNPAPVLAPSNAAYVIYTSGSTGKPKGVVVTHHNVVRLFSATDDFFKFSEKDIWTLFHSFTFDLSVWEMWGAFFYGGKLVVVPYLTSRSPQAFYELLARERATSLTQTPSAFRQLIWAGESSPAKVDLALRYVVLAGEALDLQSLRPWFNRHSDTNPDIINMYGITETTVHVTIRRITQADLEAGFGSVIGEPMSDLSLHILDEQQKPCPAGMAGEIYVGGPGVARGYLNRPELNQRRFISNPLTNVPGDRLYRSGDLAQRLPNGEIEFLGRMDDQVKIRGFRVELGEIQSALQSHAGIRENVIIAQTQKDQSTRLIAYFVPREPGLTVEELRTFLGKTLPDYMIPAVFIAMEAIPLTLNGKVDRRALPSPDKSRPELMTRLVLPSTPGEKILASIWKDILQLNEVGVHDNFFALGGDSIRSIQILSQAQQQGLRLSLETLFEKPTIYELARSEEAGAEALIEPDRRPFGLVSGSDAAKMPAEIADAYPMAKLQLGMVFHSGFAPGSAVFHDVFSYRIGFPLDAAKLELAFDSLIKRHAIFRTAFDLANYGEPLQLVYKEVKASVSVEDLASLSPAEQKERLIAWIETEKRRAFNWSRPPFTRVHAQALSNNAFQLVVSFHHSVMDGWSLARMATELMQEYAALLADRPQSITTPKITYRDFVQLEQQAVRSDKTREFWRAKLEGAPATKLPRWPASFRKGGQEQVRSPKTLIRGRQLQQLKNLAQSMGVPLKTVLFAAHCRVIGLISGQSEIVTALVANGRPQTADGERLIGVFLNSLPFRIALDDGTWKELIQRTFIGEKEILPHRRFPLSEIKQLDAGQLLLESAFDYVQFHTFLEMPGFKEGKFSEDEYFEANDFNLYATFMLDATSSELEIHFDYSPNEFSEEQARLICDYYSNTIEAMAADPDGRYQQKNLLPKSELDRLLTDWNKTSEAVPRTCIHSLIEAQTEKTPNRIAAVFKEQKLTYRELDSRASALAAELRDRGVGPEVIVGICVERSLEMLIAVLAVLKSGGAYLPLDPAYPTERIALMLDDSEARVVLTQEKFLSLFEAAPREFICVDHANEPSHQHNARARDEGSPANPDNLAYLIYTSGSTGKPKGVQISHSAVVNFLTAMKAKPGMSRDDVLLAVTTLSFDIAGLEIFLPLITGACVVIAQTEMVLNASALANAIERHGVSVMQATPTVWRTLVEAGWEGRPELKALCGGEKIDPELARRLDGLCAELWNMYGPTETTIWSTIHQVDEVLRPVPIGRPISNTQIYILNDQSQPVPTGSEGELYIGGDGLARGYFKQPQLTAERFVPSPFEPGKRLYRTGDVGRYLPDGTITISGRIDHQVKVHGHRIELGEIEAALQRHPSVSSAIVRLYEKANEDPRLIAYWVQRPAEPNSAGVLRAFLEEKLPKYMVPVAFVRLEELPLTPNGKVDRKRLPDPDLSRPEAERPFVAPRTPLEEIAAETWMDVLKLKRVGIRDDFFELGGDSLRAAQIAAKLRHRLEVDVPFASIFQNRTVESLALCLMKQLLRFGETSDPDRETAVAPDAIFDSSKGT
jgi:amino acid adenylation domain-containing protein